MSLPRWHYFIGDIHGCYETLRFLEDKIHKHAKKNNVEPFIVSVGDLVDRGPDSRAVVQHFRKGAEADTHAAVLGNHDVFFLECLLEFTEWDHDTYTWPPFLTPLKDAQEDRDDSAKLLPWEDYRMFRLYLWLVQGGCETLMSFDCLPQTPESWEIAPEDLHYLTQLPIIWQNEDFVVTHALGSPKDLEIARSFFLPEDGNANSTYLGQTLTVKQVEEHEDPNYQERLRKTCKSLTWKRGKLPVPPDENRIHLSGHTPIKRIKRFPKKRYNQIDTGCVYGQRLTAWCGEGNQTISVPTKEI